MTSTQFKGYPGGQCLGVIASNCEHYEPERALMSDDGENDTMAMTNDLKMMTRCNACLLLVLEEVPVEDTCATMVMRNERGGSKGMGRSACGLPHTPLRDGAATARKP